jgi:hypothetical protein
MHSPCSRLWHLVHTVLALGLLLFREFSESLWSLRFICSSIILQHQPLLPQVLDYGNSKFVPGLQFCQANCSFPSRECSYSTPSWLTMLNATLFRYCTVCLSSTLVYSIPLLGLWHGWREWQVFFCDFFSWKTQARRGPDLQYISCPTAYLFLNCWSKSFLFLLTLPVLQVLSWRRWRTSVTDMK